MKRILINTLCVGVTVLPLCAAFAAGPAQEKAASPGSLPTDALRAGFQNPPTTARPRTWWHWLNGNVTQEGIAKDLSWMEQVGLGGCVMNA